MSLLRKLERRDYTGGVFTNPLGLAPGAIPSPTQQAVLDNYLSVTPDTAMRHWAVWASVRIISDTISTLPIDCYQFVGGNLAEIDPLPTILRTPAAYSTWIQWLYQVMVSLLLEGNAYGLISATDVAGRPTQIDLLPPERVYVRKDQQTGRKVFRIGQQELTTDQVWHLPGPCLPGQWEGLSPIRYAARSIGLGLAAEKFGSDYFANGAHPTAIASTEQQVSQTDAEIVKERIYKATANRQIAVLGAGLKLSAWQVNPEESQFLETQRMNAVAVAQIFGVPPEMIGAATKGESVTYANREQRAQDFINNAVNPWLARLEEAISAWFPRTTYVKFNTGALLRSDLTARADYYQKALANQSWMTVDEVRELEDLPEMPIPDVPDDEPPPEGMEA